MEIQIVNPSADGIGGKGAADKNRWGNWERVHLEQGVFSNRERVKRERRVDKSSESSSNDVF